MSVMQISALYLLLGTLTTIKIDLMSFHAVKRLATEVIQRLYLLFFFAVFVRKIWSILRSVSAALTSSVHMISVNRIQETHIHTDHTHTHTHTHRSFAAKEMVHKVNSLMDAH